ncbi:acyl-CoA dehydrogenase [Variovorax sp. J22P240]|uniref:acyl-CoA dehydrogenase n=1 Tax=Variovorax sp. J22P240 TaxID=3053514 RepID=UPI002574F6E7|nr:acyl-CoA dehydrogenase [Variovorax sp. J22P240]MDL9997418.1 acyl-CoA dehydrogenase [Variovorax sp. J22P240]
MLAPVTDDALARLQQQHGTGLTLAHLVDNRLDQLPLPGAGRTLARWRVLAEVAAHDLSLVKLFEGHTDALAILQELGAPTSPQGSRWGTWCAEPPDARLAMNAVPPAEDLAGFHAPDAPQVRLTGTKAWCSGAATVTHAVVSCWNAADEPCLAAVTIAPPDVTVTSDGWHAVGMAASGSVDVRFDHVDAAQIGGPGDYVNRPGFWQGGAGIAACWFGGALGIARMTWQSSGHAPDAHRLAHLGAIDVALAAGAAVLRETAAWIDAHPKDDARRHALRARLVVEQAANEVMHHAGRAVGAGPMCRNPRFARAMADLPVFLRQSHAERDLAALGQQNLHGDTPPWML